VSPPARDWDAASYEAVGRPQEQWGIEVVERLGLSGEETVLDAGCGSGRLTRHLIERLPEGKVVAVDASPSMIEQVRAVLRPGDEAICCDLLDLDLAEPVDAVFSGATFHWIPNHDRLFERLHAALRPEGRIEAQCGGSGNVAEFLDACRAVRAEAPFDSLFEGWSEPYLFATLEETQERLAAAGFDQVRTWLSDAPTLLPAESSREFMRTVCVAPEFEALPSELHDEYLDRVRDRLEDPNFLGYVRLNISARA
jgi:trans-aconitate 2-methyltransferase